MDAKSESKFPRLDSLDEMEIITYSTSDGAKVQRKFCCALCYGPLDSLSAADDAVIIYCAECENTNYFVAWKTAEIRQAQAEFEYREVKTNLRVYKVPGFYNESEPAFNEAQALKNLGF